MTEFSGEVKTIHHSDSDVYRVLSDMRNIELLKGKIPEEKIEDLTFDEDSVSFRVNPIGMISFRMVEREPNKVIKLKSENLPFEVLLWIQLVSKEEMNTKLRMTVRADLNPFVKGMVEKPMKATVNKISELLARLPYDQI